MLLRGTLRPGSTLGPPRPVEPPSGPAPVIAVMGGQVRVGAWVVVNGSNGRPCYVRICAPGTEDYDTPFIELDLDDNPVPMFQLKAKHMGHRLDVIAKGTGPDGLANGNDATSNVIGPVLHQTDPVGTTVSNATEFGAALAAGATTIILAAGSLWESDFLSGRNMSGVTITTPQDNPAVIRDTYLRPGQLLGVVLEGVVLLHRAAWCESNRQATLQTGTNTDGITLRCCKQIGSDVLPEVYQAVPPSRAESPYVGGGMRFLAYGPSLWRSKNVRIEAHFARNVFQALEVPSSTVIRDARVDGYYFDGIRINGSLSDPADRISVRGYVATRPFGIYNEMNSAAPHMDPLQSTAGSSLRGEVDRYVSLVGNTRAKAFGGVTTNWIGEQRLRNFRFRNCVWTGRGSISAYITGSDVSLDRVTKVQVGGGGSVIRFGGGNVSQGFWRDEARVERTISRERIDRVAFPASGYYVRSDDSYVPITATDPDILDKIFGPISADIETISELALALRARDAFTGSGAITPSGHLRPFVEFPNPPAISPMPGAGGFALSLAGVSGAERYEVRYRPTGGTSATPWTRQTSTGTSFTASGLSSGSYDVQSFVRTEAGLSEWSPVETVVVN